MTRRRQRDRPTYLCFPIYVVGSDYWSGLVQWFRKTLVQNSAISKNELKLFKVLDVPRKSQPISSATKTAGHAGFKIPSENDRQLAIGKPPKDARRRR